MSPRRAWRVMAKELRLGPRSPILLFSVVMPLVLTFVITAVFGTLLDQQPRLGIVDLGSSQVTAAAGDPEGIDLQLFDDPEEMTDRLRRHDLDAGLVLPADFDARLAAGGDPGLEFFVSGESLASNRIVLAVTTLDLIREASAAGPPVEVVTVPVGDEDFVPLGDRLIPLMVFYAVVIAGMFLPASSLVEERTKGTLDAILVTPTRMSEVLAGKGTLGVALATAMGILTLALTRSFGGKPLEMTAFLIVGAAMVAEIGLILGCWARDVNTMYTAIKGGGIIIFLPALFALFPGLPQWIPRLTPTYYFLQPIYELSVKGAGFGDVWDELVVAVIIVAALIPAVAAMGRRAERRLAIVT